MEVLFWIWAIINIFMTIAMICIYLEDGDDIYGDLLRSKIPDSLYIGEILLTPVALFTIGVPILLRLLLFMVVGIFNGLAKVLGKLLKKPTQSFKDLMKIEVKIPKIKISLERKD